MPFNVVAGQVFQVAVVAIPHPAREADRSAKTTVQA